MQLRIYILMLGLAAGLQAHSQSGNFSLLDGLWKVEGKEQYESWTCEDTIRCVGKSYIILNGEEVVKETLEIKKMPDKVVYFATVIDQNNGQTIPFVLNEIMADTLSFENLSHDFPKRIQYYAINKIKLKVLVSGTSNQGFSYYMHKIE